jgi:hypothetical protein
VRAYKNYLDGQKSKREMIETYQSHLVDLLRSKMSLNKSQLITKKMLIDILELVDSNTIDNLFKSL